MKQLEVQIMGQNYLLSCPENSEARLFEAVDKVDVAMCKIRDAGKVKARDRIAVLASLNLAFQLLEAEAAEVVAQVPDRTEPAEGPGIQESHAQLDALLHRLDAALAVQNPSH